MTFLLSQDNFYCFIVLEFGSVSPQVKSAKVRTHIDSFIYSTGHSIVLC